MTAELSEVESSAPAPPPRPKARIGHLHYIDMVRVLTVALVIAVHMVGQVIIAPTLAAGALLTVAHVSREVFFLLTAFVLVYSYRNRPVKLLPFWRKRFLFVAVPYVAWSLIYYFADNSQLDPVTSAVVTFLHDLSNGSARYHLYFLLVSMQIYLTFPILRWVLRTTARHHKLVFGIGIAYQLVFFLAVQQQWHLGAALDSYLRGPDPWLTSYLGFVLAGGIAAWHAEQLVAWTRANLGIVFATCAASITAGVAVFLGQVFLGGQNVLIASNVFQPVVVVESFGIAWAFLALGLMWQDRGRPGQRWVRQGADASFGVYLAHPLLIQGIQVGAGAIGLTAIAQAADPNLVLAIEILVIVPLIYIAAAVLATLVRRTPLSLALSGRARQRRAVPAPVERMPLPFANRPFPTQGETS